MRREVVLVLHCLRFAGTALCWFAGAGLPLATAGQRISDDDDYTLTQCSLQVALAATSIGHIGFSPCCVWSWPCKSPKLQNCPKKPNLSYQNAVTVPKNPINPIFWSHGRLQPVSSQRRPMAPKYWVFWVFWDSYNILVRKIGFFGKVLQFG